MTWLVPGAARLPSAFAAVAERQFVPPQQVLPLRRRDALSRLHCLLNSTALQVATRSNFKVCFNLTFFAPRNRGATGRCAFDTLLLHPPLTSYVTK